MRVRFPPPAPVWARSSVGRALHSHCRGQGFESPRVHQINMVFLSQPTIEEFYGKVRILWGLQPNRYVKKIPDILKTGKVLDVGVGEGRNALYLARKKFTVVGVDISKRAIKKFLDLAKEKRLEVTGIVADANKYKFDDIFDAIICTATLHYFTRDQIKKLIGKMKAHTRPGGINLITAFTKSDIGYKEYPKFYFFEDEKELQDLYNDWEIIKCERYTKKEKHGDAGVHMHDIAAIIARKKS